MKSNHSVVPVVCGAYYNGYGIIRSFGEKGISTILVEGDRPTFAKYSKYLENYYSIPNPEKNEEEFVNELAKLGKKLMPRRGMFFPTGDEYVIALLKNQKILEQWFEFPMSDWETTQKIINKKNLYEVCERLGVPYPKQVVIRSIEDYQCAIATLRFPLIIKPSIWDREMITHCGTKTFVFYEWDKSGLDVFINAYFNLPNTNGELLLQEYIQGSSLNMPDVTTYTGRDGAIKCWTLQVKVRQNPPETGTSTCMKTCPTDTETAKVVLGYTKKLLCELGYYGISDAEYKLDPTDGLYKLMEINTRCHFANYSLNQSGCNMPYALYKEHLGEPVRYNEKSVVNCLYSVLPVYDRFFATVINKHRNGGYATSRKEWRESIRGPKTWYGLTWKDPLPALVAWVQATIRCQSALYRQKHNVPPTVRTIDFLRGKRV